MNVFNNLRRRATYNKKPDPFDESAILESGLQETGRAEIRGFGVVEEYELYVYLGTRYWSGKNPDEQHEMQKQALAKMSHLVYGETIDALKQIKYAFHAERDLQKGLYLVNSLIERLRKPE